MMDVSAVNDICNGAYIYKQKVLIHVSYIYNTVMIQ